MRRRDWFILFAFGATSCVTGSDSRSASDSIRGRDPTVADLVLEVTIGAESAGPPEYQLSGIHDIAVTRDGTIWVLDGETTPFAQKVPQLRQFTPDGKFLRQVLRDGTGPGEYQSPYVLANVPGDRVALRDYAKRGEIPIYSSDGKLDTLLALGNSLNWPLHGGEALQVDTGGVLWLPFTGRPGPNRGRPQFLRARLDGAIIDTVPFPVLPEVKRAELSITRTSPGGGTSVRGFSVPYEPRATWALSPFGSFVVAGTDRYRIEILAPPVARSDSAAPKRPSRIVERNVPPVPISDDERAVGRAELLKEIASVEGAGGLVVPEMPTQKPPIRGVTYTDDGRLLVLVSMPSQLTSGGWKEPWAYDLFDHAERFAGRIVLPDAFALRRLRGNEMWGVYRDSLDLESVRRYRIVWR